jgi:hypothetical protein
MERVVEEECVKLISIATNIGAGKFSGEELSSLVESHQGVAYN